METEAKATTTQQEEAVIIVILEEESSMSAAYVIFKEKLRKALSVWNTLVTKKISRCSLEEDSDWDDAEMQNCRRYLRNLHENPKARKIGDGKGSFLIPDGLLIRAIHTIYGYC